MNKYRNKKTICNQGHKHDSKKEALYCNDLELLKRAFENIFPFEFSDLDELLKSDYTRRSIQKDLVSFL